MKLKKFKLDRFIDTIHAYPSIDEEDVKQRETVLKQFNRMIQLDETTPEILDSFTFEDLEWIYDMLMMWPIVEAGILEKEDMDHIGFQSIHIHVLIQNISRLKPVKKKVTFL